MMRYFTRMHLLNALCIALSCCLFACSSSQNAMESSPSETAVTAADITKTATEKEESEKEKGDFKAYSEVIPEDAKSDEGLFTVHFVDDKLYYEIPDSTLNVDMLWVSRIAGTPTNLSPYINAGSKVNEQVVRWVRKDKKILLKAISYTNVADEETPIYKSVQYNNFEPIIEAFSIEALNEDSTGVVIEVTDLFTDDVPVISGLSDGLRERYKVRGLDGNRSFIDTARSYPINIEVVHTQTYRAAAPPTNARTNTLTLLMNQSMILLPKDKMMPRLHDERVGWFTVSQYDYNSDALKSDRKTYIRRWRLEPKDPEAYARGELVEPVKPIVYYLDPATPEIWRPYFKQGIEDWQTAFEKAGFKNAIIAKDPPSPEEDPEFSPEDARYSTVRYVASTTRNAVGPSVSDPRTGEILESDIIWYHNHLRSYRNRYMLETGAANPKARTLDTPEEEIGEMMRRVISHEIGHAIGLPHNMKASAAYPVDSLRSGEFSQEYGIATTIMDYARYNYIAQPGDENIRFIRQLGPYDMYAVNWGYRYLPNAETPEDEVPTLFEWIDEKEGDPMYMFGGRSTYDPTSQTESIGDDAMKASSYGLANLKIVANNLIDWTTEEGEDYDDLEELYGELVSVWNRYIGHVVTNVGGVYETLKTADQDGVVYEVVPENVQENAMAWLLDNAFTDPEWLVQSDIYARIDAAGAVENIRSLQARHLNNLLNASRMQRLIEAEAMHGASAYELTEMLTDLRRGIWTEAYGYQFKDYSVYRRNLQRAYLERMEHLLTEDESGSSYDTDVDVSQSDIRPAVKAELKMLRTQLQRAVRRAPQGIVMYHLEDALDRIDHILNPEG